VATYKQAGVNINAGDELVRRIKRIAPDIGAFAGLFPLDVKKYKNPVLVSSTDGVGTKLKVAQLCNRHDTVGQDLVAMCVNDVITCGAKPLLFLDYFAAGKLNVDVAEEVINGISKACRQANCKLIGGETAEMPGFYTEAEYDIAGFAVGIVEKNEIIDGSKTRAGDLILGLPSSGLHSNGYSLVREIFSPEELKDMGEELLKPTKLYVKEILGLVPIPHSRLRRLAAPFRIIKGIAHITGGGFINNIPRVLPAGCRAVIDRESWQVPQIFKLIQQHGKVEALEMFRTFNMGIGMVLFVSKGELKNVSVKIKDAIVIGEVIKGERGVEFK
jgi:phosphoribosylformylglycinamidine cyclo-ligase